MPPGSTDRVPYATFPFTFAVLAIVRRLWQTSSPSKYPEILIFAASTLPITLAFRPISKVFDSISPLNEPKRTKLSDTFSSPSMLASSEMSVIFFVLIATGLATSWRILSRCFSYRFFTDLRVHNGRDKWQEKKAEASDKFGVRSVVGPSQYIEITKKEFCLRGKN